MNRILAFFSSNKSLTVRYPGAETILWIGMNVDSTEDQ